MPGIHRRNLSVGLLIYAARCVLPCHACSQCATNGVIETVSSPTSMDGKDEPCLTAT